MAFDGKKREWRERHGKSTSRAYSSWAGMVGRCTNPNDPAFENYGERGITVCDEWRTFLGFYADMGDPPIGLSLDRIDNEKGYFKDNCRWADRETQSRNRRMSRQLTAFGRTMLLCDWARESGLGRHTISRRIKQGWSVDLAVSAPVVSERKGIPRGERVIDHQEYGDRHGVKWSDGQ